jgi:hypothetical protein
VLRVEPITKERVDYVFAHLWPRGVEELKRLGVDLETAARNCVKWAVHGHCGVICADAPVVVYGTCPNGDHTATWFQATDEFVKYHPGISEIIRGALRAVPGTLYVYSVMVHPKTGKWFNSLGLVKDDWEGTTAANWPLFRFKRA